MIYLEGFNFFRKDKDPKEIIGIFSDVFTELDDMGAWVSYSGHDYGDHDYLVDIESDSPINVDKNQIYFEIKTTVDTDEMQISNPQENQIKIYKYLQSNINNLINRFESLSKYKVKKVGGNIIFEEGYSIIFKKIKTNLSNNRFKFENIDSDRGKIVNIILHFIVPI